MRRGILVNPPLLKKVPYLPEGTPVTAADGARQRASDSSTRDRRDGVAAGGREGSGSGGAGRLTPQAMGVPADGGAGAGFGRDGVPFESDRDILGRSV
jgi:hypothetical protein